MSEQTQNKATEPSDPDLRSASVALRRAVAKVYERAAREQQPVVGGCDGNAARSIPKSEPKQ